MIRASKDKSQLALKGSLNSFKVNWILNSNQCWMIGKVTTVKDSKIQSQAHSIYRCLIATSCSDLLYRKHPVKQVVASSLAMVKCL